MLTIRRFLQVGIPMPTSGVCNLQAPTLCSAARDCRPTRSNRPHPRYARFVGRHPHADRRGLQPASADALSGGKGLPPYFHQANEGSNYHKAFFIFSHKTMNHHNFNRLQQKKCKNRTFYKIPFLFIWRFFLLCSHFLRQMVRLVCYIPAPLLE